MFDPTNFSLNAVSRPAVTRPVVTAETVDRLELDEPADDFVDSFLLGNGWLGAAMRGIPGRERISLNIDTLWSGGPVGRPASPRTDVGELREAIRRGDLTSSERLAGGLQSPTWAQSYVPLGDLEIEWTVPHSDSSPDATRDYIRTLDLASAEATVRDGESNLSAFVSKPDGVLVLSAGGSEGAVALTSQLRVLDSSDRNVGGVQWIVCAGRAPADIAPWHDETEDAVRWPTDEPAEDGTVAEGMGWAMVAAVANDPATGERRVILTAEAGYRGWNERPSADLHALEAVARDRVSEALAMSTSELRQRHITDHASLYDRVQIDLTASAHPQALRAQQYFNLGRYLLIASSRPGSQAANLQGIWNSDLRAPWASGYTTNINLQMNYWGAEAAALPELQEPLFALIEELVEAGCETARLYYGAGGSVAHHNTDLWRFTAPVDGRTQWSNWHMALPWLAMQLGENLDFQWSDEVARVRALPVFRSLTQFVLDMLVEHSDGTLVISPSTSPEHEFRVGTATAAVTFGSAIDQELAAEVLRRFIQLTDTVEGSAEPPAELRGRAGAALHRLRMPSIDSNGRLAEWAQEYDGAEAGHRHLSHLVGLYPGSRITETETPEEFEAVRRSLAHRLANGSGGTGWSQAWVLGLAARLRDRELVASSLDVLLTALSSRSLLDLHPFPRRPSGTVFQIDGNLGAVAGIAELFVSTSSGCLTLLPVLPSGWSAGSVRGLRARGGLTVDLIWRDNRLVEGVVTCARNGPLSLEVHADFPLVLEAHDGSAVATRSSPAPSRVNHNQMTWWASAGQLFRIRPTSAG